MNITHNTPYRKTHAKGHTPFDLKFVFYIHATDLFEELAKRKFGRNNVKQVTDGKVNIYINLDEYEGYTVVFSHDAVEIRELKGRQIEVLEYEDSDTPRTVAREVMTYV